MQKTLAFASRNYFISRRGRVGNNFRKFMRISFYCGTLLLITAQLLMAKISGAQDIREARVALELNNVTLKNALQKLQKESGYSIFYLSSKVAPYTGVSLKKDTRTVQQTLELILENTRFKFRQEGEMIILTERQQSTTEKTASVLQQITGKVTDENGEVLPGVSVIVKGTTLGTTTDENGSYQLQLSDVASPVLIFSFVGYLSQENVVGNNSIIDIRLKADTKALEEVVVVGYGTQKKISVNGAVASISTKEIRQSPAANLAVTLAGRLPGLTALQRSGEPGRDNTLLYLRGRGTLNGQNPIILVDGVERDLTYIDPNEVENITILKDASSTALFGVRGANGVILVTTKRGTSDKPRITLTAERGVQDFTRSPSVVNSYDWARLRNEAWQNDNPNADPTNPANRKPYTDYALERFRLGDYPEVYPNNNWQDMLFHKTVAQTRYNLNLSGGSDFITYFVNVGMLNQGGQWKVAPDLGYDPSAFLKRYNFRSNIDAVLNKTRTLKTFLNVAGYLEKINSPNVNADEIFRRVYSFFPVVLPGPLTPDGQVLIGQGLYNESPWAYINRSGYSQETRSNVMASWGLEQDLKFITKGLSAKFMTSFDTRTVYNLTASKSWQRWIQLSDPNLLNSEGRDSVFYQRVLPNVENTPLSTSTSSAFQSFFNFQFFVNYNRTFAEKHEVTGLVLAQQEVRIRPNERLPYNLRGVSSRLTYGYDRRYYGEFNAGYNGSEQFAKGKRYGFFPSFSLGWVISNEDFLAQSKVISLLKVRGSYGKVGSDQLGGRRFLYLDDIQRGGGGYSGTLGQGGLIGENYLGNPDVRWENARKSNVGFELGLFDQLTLTADFFQEKRDNVLIYRNTIPVLNGVALNSLPPVNMGIVENHGYELELNYNKVIRPDFSVLTKLNFNYAKNKVVYADEPMLPSDYAYRYRTTGYPIGQYFGYKTAGYYNSQQEIDEEQLRYVGRAPRPGDFRYVDLNKDGTIDERDTAPIGYSAIPEYTFGGAVTVNYKNFDLSVLAQGVFNVSDNLSGYGVYEYYDFRERHKNAWTPERAAAGEKIEFPALSLAESSSERSNDFFIENRSFLRLKNVEIGYRLPTDLVSKIKAKEVRLYINGLNIFTWDKMKVKDYDPEVSNSISYPVYRIFNAGFNITF